MAKKADMLEQAKKLNLEVTEKNTIAEIESAINAVDSEGVDNGAAKEANTDQNQTDQENEVAEVKTAKAGKRSAKAIAESEEKAAKEARKADDSDEENKPSGPMHVQKVRSRLERSGKKMREAAKLVEKGKEYSSKQALEIAQKTSTTKFDSTVELHVRLGVDPKQADQNIRENIMLPEGTGKAIRVAVFGDAEVVAEAKKAGADIAGSDEFLQQLDKEKIDFDVLIATPNVMAKLGKYARLLGPKGLMPNPKSGTVTKDVTKAIEQAKAGKVEARVDEAGIVHLGFGKVSFGTDRLLKNLQTIYATLRSAKPSSVKGSYVESIYISTSMGPSIKVSSSEL